MVGYATIYTMFPVFSLVLDKDVSGTIALTYPELYKDLTKGRSLSFKTFFSWVLISIYQGYTYYIHLLIFKNSVKVWFFFKIFGLICFLWGKSVGTNEAFIRKVHLTKLFFV